MKNDIILRVLVVKAKTRFFSTFIIHLKTTKLIREKALAKKIVITSGKGGVGKTTVTVNLGRALANLGYRVALIDVDFGLNNLDVVMGLENKIVYDIADVIEGRCRVKQALIQDIYRKNLYVLPSSSIESYSSLSGQNIKLLLEGITNVFDYILIDCPAGIDVGFHRAVSCSNGALIVTTPSLPSLKDANKVIGILKSYKLDNMGLIVNRVRGDLIAGGKMILPLDIQSILKTELVGVLPEEDEVFLSCGYSLSKGSLSHSAYKILANNVVKNKKKIFDTTSKYTGILGSIRRGLKKSL